MEVVGTVASVLTLAQVAKSCIEMYDTLVALQEAPRELMSVILHLQMEQIRFHLWCQYTGPPFSLRALIQRKEEHGGDSGNFLDLMEIIMSTNSDTDMTEMLRPKLSISKRALWLSSGRKAMKNIKDGLQQFNDQLWGIFGITDLLRLQGMMQMTAAATPVRLLIKDIEQRQDVNSLPAAEYSLALLPLVQIAERSAQMNAMKPTTPETTFHTILREAGLVLQKDGSTSDIGPRFRGRYCDERVMVEWRYHLSNLSAEEKRALHIRVQMLTMQIQQSCKISGFNVLPCKGWFYSAAASRFAIVFSEPWPESARVVTFRRRLLDDRAVKRRRCLEDRFRLAASVFTSVHRLATVGWLHKNLSSDNFVLSESEGEWTNAPAVYLCGFGFSRRDDPDEMSEQIPTIVRVDHAEKAARLYRHPMYDARLERHPLQTGFRYRKHFDFYSLGIVLLEIGLWHPVSTLCPRSMSVFEFRQTELERRLRELQFLMGRKYFRQVNKCLSGIVDEPKGQVQTSALTQVESSGADSQSSDYKYLAMLEAGLDELMGMFRG